MPQFTFKYKLLKTSARLSGARRRLSGSADELREKYRSGSHTINFLEKAWDPALEYERRLEHGLLTSRLTHKDSTMALMYIPGSDMLQYPAASYYNLYEELALKTHRDVIIPYYPLCTDCSMNESMDAIYSTYKLLLREYSSNHVAVAGCGAGGNLALALVSHINAMAENLSMPDKLYVSSPEMCIYSQEERRRAEQLDKSDIYIPAGWLDAYRDIIANGRELPLYMPYPQLGDYSGLKEAYVCFADSEVLYAMCGSLVSRMESAGVNVTLEVGQGMFHGYPVLNRTRECSPGHANMIAFLTDQNYYINSAFMKTLV